MTIKLHFDDLRPRQLGTASQLVIGHTLLVCHVPLNNPFTSGVQPYCYERELAEVQFSSYNEREGRPNETRAEFSSLSTPNWVFRTKENDFPGGQPYMNWHYFETYGIDFPNRPTFNYVLDLTALAREGIEVLQTTRVEYVISEKLRLEREWEDQMFERSFGGDLQQL